MATAIVSSATYTNCTSILKGAIIIEFTSSGDYELPEPGMFVVGFISGMGGTGKIATQATKNSKATVTLTKAISGTETKDSVIVLVR